MPGQRTTLMDMTGQVFDRWTVVELAPRRPGVSTQWVCRCVCGKVALVRGSHLRQGNSRGCADCHWLEESETRLSDIPEYIVWSGIKQRCFNQNSVNHKNYGGRGITMHPEWVHDFHRFLEHVGPRPGPGSKWQLDRINNDGNYEPGNVRWATVSENSRNKRTVSQLSEQVEIWKQRAIDLGWQG